MAPYCIFTLATALSPGVPEMRRRRSGRPGELPPRLRSGAPALSVRCAALVFLGSFAYLVFGCSCVVWRRFVFGARKLPRGAASPHLSMRYRPQCLDRPLPRFPRKWRAGPPMGSRLRNRNASGDIAGRIFAPYNIMLVGVVRRCDERRRNCRDSIP